jgi:2-polyprenyl-3-methyl-5-hydroxy-6-metoxy-1,4-benzoquinol methylase
MSRNKLYQLEIKNAVPNKSTDQKDYTEGLIYRQSAWWKKLLNVQAPYKWNINRLDVGFVLDVGCGIGRNLLHLDGKGIGVDHNETSICVCRSRGLTAYTVDDFMKSAYNQPETFDTMLLAHVAEHMTAADVDAILGLYAYLIKKNGKIIIITPQEAGFRSDDTHVEFMDFLKVDSILTKAGFKVAKQYSFPFPRVIGKIFKYNEFITVAQKS